MPKYVYSFGKGKAEGRAEQRDLLGGKGANLAEMMRLGIPVPPGFTISTRACNAFFEAGGRIPRDVREQTTKAFAKLEVARGKSLNDPHDPLLVSVRSGAKFSMPGMMDTVLNLGLNDQIVEGLAARTGDRRFAFDSYRRLIQMYGDVVLEIDKSRFESLLDAMKSRRGVVHDTELSAKDLERLCEQYRRLIVKQTGSEFPQQPKDQVWGAITAVFRSWNNPRARLYRRQYGIPDSLGTAVNVQSMVYGNLGDDCATGVAFTRNPATGENELYGEYLINAQGEDVVAGIRTPQPITAAAAGNMPERSMERRMPGSFARLLEIRATLEKHYRDMQDVEFTIERGELYMLQTRTGKRTGQAAMRIAFDLHRSRVLTKEQVVARIEPEMVTQLLAPVFDAEEVRRATTEGHRLATGLPAGPGAASGAIAFSAQRAEELAAAGRRVLLVRNETSPEDLGGMVAAAGILTARGGMTSHAAVVARGMGRPCIVGAEELRVDEAGRHLIVGSNVLSEGDTLSIDGSTGHVYEGALTTLPSEIQQGLRDKRVAKRSETYQRFNRLMRWADSLRRLKIRTNADTPEDSALARGLGAEGIGLCRTEHMFFAEERILAVRQMILATDERERAKALKKLLPMQRKDFEGIFKAMQGLPVTIRLLDPPLHEFLPRNPAQFRRLATELGADEGALKRQAELLHEVNPMLGHRGCRLGVTFPEIYDMQVRAILEAATRQAKKGVRVEPEIMIPLVGTAEEFRRLAERVREVASAVATSQGKKIKYLVGTMIEIPRAAITSQAIAEEAEFFSYGTNDLTQMTFGYSRDDAGKFLPHYVQSRILEADPFQTLDVDGVGRLIDLSVREGRSARAGLKIGVCGEHGGDPASVGFFHDVRADYVSCSPYRVPVARLAAAQAALAERGQGSVGSR